jgi:formylglycine-generating enzyme required for sulfatase activity
MNKNFTLLLLLITPFSIFAKSSVPSKMPDQLEIPEGMVYIPGGSYTRGNDKHFGTTARYPEESPEHLVSVDAFLIDITEVTNKQFEAFVQATGYRTFAEKGPNPSDFPNAPADQMVPGAMIFYTPDQKVELWKMGAENNWWRFIEGANWRQPSGPGSSIENKMDHPVVCVNKDDAMAYAKWIGKRLPTEAEWERAARGGMERKIFSWGDTPLIDDKWMANCYQGTFPKENTALDGFIGTAPVKSFPKNGYGLFDMSGNVWEICSDYYRHDAYKTFIKNPEKNPKGPSQPIDTAINNALVQGLSVRPNARPIHPLFHISVTKGGSFLCHHTYCLRYRPAARSNIESISPTNHVGFRLVKDL